MDTIALWATILSPIIAVLIAFVTSWWVSRSGARDTAKLIKYAKKLMLINLRVKILELSKEAKEEHVQFSSLLKKSMGLSEQINGNFSEWPKEVLMQYKEKERDIDDKKDLTIDKRMVITETMTDVIELIKEIEKL